MKFAGSLLLCALLVGEASKWCSAFTMGTHNNAAIPQNIETHKTITKCALDRVAYAYLQTLNPALGNPAECGTDGIFNDLLRAAESLNMGISEHKKVRDLVWQSSVNVDFLYDYLSRYHFDGEQFEAGNDMIIDNTKTSRDLLRAGQFSESRRLIGEMLHTVQDFYSHSNWLEMGNTLPLGNLGVSRDLGFVAEQFENTCSGCQQGEYGYCYYDIREEINMNQVLTSGYYTGQDVAKPEQVEKCHHGGYLDMPPNQGINKDSVNTAESVNLSPHGYLHFDAAKMALEASVLYLTNFWEMLGDEDFAKFLAFDRRSSTIVITMDTTGSMAEEIEACLLAAEQLALTFSTTVSQPAYVLSQFNDPTYGPAVYYENVSDFVGALRALKAYQGFDYPEYSMHGILLGANAVRQPGGIMFVYTDDEAKDPELEEEVINLLKEKALIVHFIITPAVHPVNLTLYQRIASASGGQVLRVLDETTITDTTMALFNATFVSLVLDPSAEIIEMLYARSSAPVNSTPAFAVSTDDSVGHMSVVMTTDSSVFPQVTVTAESSTVRRLKRGSELNRNSVPVDYSVLYSDGTKSLIEIANPPVGKITIQGVFLKESQYSLSVTGSANFNVQVLFMRDTAVGLAPVLSGQPLIGQPIWAFAEVDDPNYVIDNVTLLDDSSQAILSAAAQPLASDPQSFAALFLLPAQAFRVLVEGVNSQTNERFMRLTSSQFRATAASLQLADAESSFAVFPGDSKSIRFELGNLDNVAHNFLLKVSGTSDSLKHNVSHSLVQLASNETMIFSVIVTVPKDQSLVGVVDTITVVATVQDSDDSNSMIVTGVVRDPYRDATPPNITILEHNSGICQLNRDSPCSETVWNARVAAQDTHSGLQDFYLRDMKSRNVSGLGLTVSFSPVLLAGTNQTIVGSFVAPCCVKYLAFVAVDMEGNLNQASFDSSWKDPYVPESAASRQIIPTGLLLLLLLFYSWCNRF